MTDKRSSRHVVAVFVGAVIAASAANDGHAEDQLDDIREAKAIFAAAKAASDKDGGRLWGVKLYGRLLLVDANTGLAIANEADPKGVLHEEMGVYVGALPKDVIIANAPVEWEGVRWTMQILQTIPQNPVDRAITLSHEMFHRVQPGLHLVADDTPCLDLDSVDGRVWMQLEWRALGAALIETGSAQTAAIRDALAFRARRQSLFEGARKAEASQEIAEGVPEFTGVMIGEPDVEAARWRAAGKLLRPDTTISFVRSFAYTSGPAYGLLLDQRAPGWRTRITTKSDLGALLGATLPVAGVSAEERAGLYGAAEIRILELDRAEKAEAIKAHYRAVLVTGPVLTTPPPGNFSFNPSSLVTLGDGFTVYPTFHAEAAWGALDVKDGVRIPTDFSSTTLAAPTSVHGAHLEGPGWTIDLAPGWTVAPGVKAGGFILKRD